MLKFPGIGRPMAVSVMWGLSLLTVVGCRHADHHQQPCPVAGNYCPTAPYNTPGTMPQPDAGQDAPMPPEPEPITPAPREAYGEPPRRNPVQAIKDRLRPLGSKLGRFIKRDEPAATDEPVGQDRVYSPEPQMPNTVGAQPQWGQPAGTQPQSPTGAGQAYPPQVPPADDYDQFDAADENLPLGLPQGNIPGDVELPNGNADFRRPKEKLMLPVSDPQREFDLYVPQSRNAAPTPHLAPVPVDDQETTDDDDNDFSDVNFGGDDFDPPGSQLLEAPGDGAKQVKFVPVENGGLNVFQIGTFALCSEVRSYEDFSEIDRNELRAGQELLIYNTLRNTESVKSAEGFRTLTRSRVEWLGAGDRVLHQVQLSEAPDASRSVRQDYFLTHRVAVPQNLPAGLYTMRLTVEDLFGHQVAHSTMQVRVSH